MGRALLAYLYAALLALALVSLWSHNDAHAPLFWQVVLTRLSPDAPARILCDLRDRAQLPRGERCGATAANPAQTRPDQPAP